MRHWEEVRISQFFGPLDLLWSMVSEKKIDIMSVNLLEIVDQYLDYIKMQQELDIEIASEYLVMAGQLIQIKAKSLLPKMDDELEDDGMNYDDLIFQLTQYDQIKSVTDFFLKQQEVYTKTFSKEKTKQKFTVLLRKQNYDELFVDPLNMDMDDFAQIFKRIMMESQERAFESEEDYFEEYSTITTEVISPEEVTIMILETMQTNKTKTWKLEELLIDNVLNVRNLISAFLSILDLVRHQVILVNQINHTLEVAFSIKSLEDDNFIEASKRGESIYD